MVYPSRHSEYYGNEDAVVQGPNNIITPHPDVAVPSSDDNAPKDNNPDTAKSDAESGDSFKTYV